MSFGSFSLRWLEAASRDLNAIVAYIAADSKIAAVRMLDSINERVSRLVIFPLSGESCPLDRRVRRVIEGNYVIYYTVEETEVIIRGVIHGARMLRRSWLESRKRMKE